jgi:hypothetical protein
MMRTSTALAALVFVSLAGCGSDLEDALIDYKVSLSESSVGFNYVQGTVPDERHVTLKGEGSTGGNDVYVDAVAYTGSGIATPNVDIHKQSADIGLNPQAGLAPGTYSGSVRVSACRDSGCSKHYDGSPAYIDYTIVVRAP